MQPARRIEPCSQALCPGAVPQRRAPSRLSERGPAPASRRQTCFEPVTPCASQRGAAGAGRERKSEGNRGKPRGDGGTRTPDGELRARLLAGLGPRRCRGSAAALPSPRSAGPRAGPERPAKVRRGAAVPSRRVLGPAGEGRAAVGACALHTPALSPPDRVDPRLMPPDSSPRPRSPSPFLLPSRPLLPRSSAGFNKRKDPSFLSFESKRCLDWLKRGAHGVFAKIFPNNTRPSLPKFLGKRALSGKTMTENKSVVGVPVGIPGVSTRLLGSPSQALLLIRRLIRGAGDLPRGNGGGTGLPSPRHWGLC